MWSDLSAIYLFILIPSVCEPSNLIRLVVRMYVDCVVMNMALA